MKVATHDLNRIEQMKRIRMLRSVLKDCKMVKQQYQKVESFLDSGRSSDSGGSQGILAKVGSMIENPSDIAGFEALQQKQSSLQELVSFDINRLKGGSMAFQREMDTERERQETKIKGFTTKLTDLDKHVSVVGRMLKR